MSDMNDYSKVLSGVVALTYMDRSLIDFARAVKRCLEIEQEKINPDNALIATLCDAARVGWEYGKTAQQGESQIKADHTAEIVEMLDSDRDIHANKRVCDYISNLKERIITKMQSKK